MLFLPASRRVLVQLRSGFVLLRRSVTVVIVLFFSFLILISRVCCCNSRVVVLAVAAAAIIVVVSGEISGHFFFACFEHFYIQFAFNVLPPGAGAGAGPLSRAPPNLQERHWGHRSSVLQIPGYLCSKTCCTAEGCLLAGGRERKKGESEYHKEGGGRDILIYRMVREKRGKNVCRTTLGNATQGAWNCPVLPRSSSFGRNFFQKAHFLTR